MSIPPWFLLKRVEGLKVNNCEEGEVRIERDGIVNLLPGLQGYGGQIKIDDFVSQCLKPN